MMKMMWPMILGVSLCSCHSEVPRQPVVSVVPAVLGTVSPADVSGIHVGMKRHEAEAVIKPNSGGPASPMSVAVFDGTNTLIMSIHYGHDDTTVTNITWRRWGHE